MLQKRLFLFLLLVCGGYTAFSQDLKTTIGDNKALDSLRKKEQTNKDSVIFNSKYVRFTTLRLSKDSIQTLALDTTLRNLENYNVLYQPDRPTIGLGNLGLPARPLLFEAQQTTGFNAGFHSLDAYALLPEDVAFYRARSPFTRLYYVNAGEAEQVLKVTHSQNVKPNWNIGANYNRIGANGFYSRQRGDDTGVALFSWYQTRSKRYNLFATIVFNTLRAAENGAITNDTIFTKNAINIDPMAEPVRLNTARQLSNNTFVTLRNTYFIGRIDSVLSEGVTKILPTNKVTYNFEYNRQSFSFTKNEADPTNFLPEGMADQFHYLKVTPGYTRDSTNVYHLKNEVVWGFFLRPKSGGARKNEIKIDAGIRHDFYQYSQLSKYESGSNLYNYNTNFQNITLLGNAGYKFSDKFELGADVQQIIQGHNFGDFRYGATGKFLIGATAGKVIVGASLLNKSPEQIYQRHFSNHYQWIHNFDNTKTVNFNFNYINEAVQADLKAEYFLLSNYLYFKKSGLNSIEPAQEASDISLIRLSAKKTFNLGKFGLDQYLVYQKTNNENILRTPEVYTFTSLHFKQTFFKVLKTVIGVDVRYNTSYLAYSYSVPASQFYIGDPVKLDSKPVGAVWLKAGLRRANLFVKYDYVTQGAFDRGFYTVDTYPMGNRLFKFGVSWNFYD